MQYLYYDDKPLTSLGGIAYQGGPLGRAELIRASREDRLIDLLKEHMEAYLSHFIECEYRPCYWTIYKSILIPFLDDIDVVKKVLKSDVIKEKDKDDVYIDTDGVKMYFDLYLHLCKVQDKKVKIYVEETWIKISKNITNN
tara:strand:+ start:53 stop:475 length:423 start_codon:yes stop_codon:yes gene_type:complete